MSRPQEQTVCEQTTLEMTFQSSAALVVMTEWTGSGHHLSYALFITSYKCCLWFKAFCLVRFFTLYSNGHNMFSKSHLVQQVSSLWHISVLNMDLHIELYIYFFHLLDLITLKHIQLIYVPP